MTGAHTYAYCIKWRRTPQLSEAYVMLFVFSHVVTHYTAVHESTTSFVIKVTTMKNTNDFCCERKPFTCHHQTFRCHKDEWHTKEDAGKSIKNALCMPKDTSRAEGTSNSEKIKPIALAIVELHWSEGISQAVVSRKLH